MIIYFQVFLGRSTKNKWEFLQEEFEQPAFCKKRVAQDFKKLLFQVQLIKKPLF